VSALLDECEFDCDYDSDCAGALLCADEHKEELQQQGCDKRKVYCGNVGAWNLEVCYNPDTLDLCTGDYDIGHGGAHHGGEPLGECEFDCDYDTDCEDHLLCADEHKADLELAGYDKRKAHCTGNVGEWNEEVCYDPSKIV